jgi:hypothetical protein
MYTLSAGSVRISLRIYFLSDYKGQRDVRLANLLYACYGLKNSRKGKSYFTIKSYKLAYYMRGKGARVGSNSQLHKHPF